MPISHHNQYVTSGNLEERLLVAPHRQIQPRLDAGTPVLRGNIGRAELQPGLHVHFADTEDLENLKIETLCQPRLVLSVFLQGAVDATIGGIPIPMPSLSADTNLWQPVASLRAQSTPQVFVRSGRRGDRLRKVIISMSMEWLNGLADASSGDMEPVLRFARQELDIRSWTPSASSLALAEQILAVPLEPQFFFRLYIESRALALVAEAFNQVCEGEEAGFSIAIRARDRDKLQDINRYLADHNSEAVSAADLAAGVGVSVNALRRLVVSARGMTPGKYIRTYRLEQARTAIERDGVSVAEAAYRAGYTSPGNFATAFKRCFGHCPSTLYRS